jgi:hypothetical protein
MPVRDIFPFVATNGRSKERREKDVYGRGEGEGTRNTTVYPQAGTVTEKARVYVLLRS